MTPAKNKVSRQASLFKVLLKAFDPEFRCHHGVPKATPRCWQALETNFSVIEHVSTNLQNAVNVNVNHNSVMAFLS